MKTMKTGVFINTAKASCSIHESGRMVYACLSQSSAFKLDYYSLDIVDISALASTGKVQLKPGAEGPSPAEHYDFWVFNWHFYTMAMDLDPNVIARLQGPKFTVVLELAPGDPLQLVPPGIFDAHMALDPGATRTGTIYPFPRPLDGQARTEDIAPRAVPVIGSFGFATPGKGFETLVAAANAEFDQAVIRINIPTGDFVGSDVIHRTSYPRYLEALCQRIAKPGIEVQFTYEFMDPDALVDWCGENDLNCFMYTRCQPGLSATTDQAIVSGRPLLTSSNDTFRHIHQYIPPYPLTSLRDAIAQATPAVRAMQQDWSIPSFNARFAQMLADFGVATDEQIEWPTDRVAVPPHDILIVSGHSREPGLFDRANRIGNALGRTGKYQVEVGESGTTEHLLRLINEHRPAGLVLADWGTDQPNLAKHFAGPVITMRRVPARAGELTYGPVVPYQTVGAALDPTTTVWLIGHAGSPTALDDILDRIERELPGARICVQALPTTSLAEATRLQRSLEKRKGVEATLQPLPETGEAAIAAYAPAALILLHDDGRHSDHIQNIAELAMITERAVAFDLSSGFGELAGLATDYGSIELRELIAMGMEAQMPVLARFAEGFTYTELDRALAPQLVRRRGRTGKAAAASAGLDRNPEHVAVISQIYQEVLGRGPDPQGLQHYLHRMGRGASAARITRDIANSAEAKQRRKELRQEIRSVRHLLALRNEEFVEAAYREVLGRQPDSRGLTHHLGLLRDGVSRSEVLAGLALSAEGQNTDQSLPGLDRLVARQSGLTARLGRWVRPGRRRRQERRALAALEARATALEQAARNTVHHSSVAAEILAGLAPVPERPEPVGPEPTLPQPVPAQPLVATLPPGSAETIHLLVGIESFGALPCLDQTRTVAHALVAGGHPLRLVVWDPIAKRLNLVSREELAELNWSFTQDGAFEWYPSRDEMTFTIDRASSSGRDWLVICGPVRQPESPAMIVETNLELEARRLGLRAVFMFDGAKAITSADAPAPARECEEQYMQALLMARSVVATSDAAMQQLETFFAGSQSADVGPARFTLPLPPADGSANEAADYADRLRSRLAEINAPSRFISLHSLAKPTTPIAIEIDQALASLGFSSRKLAFANRTGALSWDKAADSRPASEGLWLVLDAGMPAKDLHRIVTGAAAMGLEVAILIDQTRQLDALLAHEDGCAALGGAARLVCSSETVAAHAWQGILATRMRFPSAGSRIMTVTGRPGHRSTQLAALAERLADESPRAWQMPLPRGSRADAKKAFPGLSDRPRLSICISTYNRAKWLRTSLHNIARQVGAPRPDLEIVVVDNTSTDETAAIPAEFAHRPDFRFYRNPVNVGMLGNLAVTAQRARGDYIWILGDDDLTRAGVIDRIMDLLNADPTLELIYMNYGYTSEPTPDNVSNLDEFLDGYNVLQPPCPDERGTVASLAAKTENFYTAIYSHVYRRDHGQRAYCQDTSGRIFSTMRACIPTTCYVLREMGAAPAFWIGDPSLVVNSNVSWVAYGPMLDLEHLPESWDMAERIGCPAEQVDMRRSNRLWLVEMMWRQLFENDTVGNAAYISPAKVIMRFRHLPEFAQYVPEFRRIYEAAREAGHPATTLPTPALFAAF